MDTLVPLENCKAVLGSDDRDDAMSAYCLRAATFSIEQYCMRRLLHQRHCERIEYYGNAMLPLREYPLTELLIVKAVLNNRADDEIIEPDFYELIPDCGIDHDIPFLLSLSPAVQRYRNISAIKVTYYAGYAPDAVPPDLACACLELAAWNMGRYKGKRIGLTGTVRGNGQAGEHFEMSMPENVRLLLEPYKRKVI